MQLRELALLNGTLRENDGPRCSNCGAADHKSWMVSIMDYSIWSHYNDVYRLLLKHNTANNYF